MATLFGIGYFPWAPASLASLVITVLYYVFARPAPIYIEFLILAAITWIGVITSTLAERELGLDAHPIVIDEVAGMVVTYLLVPLPADPAGRLTALIVGLGLFRFFDIVKPWPADKLQNLPGGRGIMADDLMAGIYSNICLRLVMAMGALEWVRGF